MGHIKIDPGKGKLSCPGPEQRTGRQNLFPLLQNVRPQSSTLHTHSCNPVSIIQYDASVQRCLFLKEAAA